MSGSGVNKWAGEPNRTSTRCFAVDPSSTVAAAAEIALGVVCASCGYAGLRELVAANADYVIDGVCRQLRHLDPHSRSVSKHLNSHTQRDRGNRSEP